MPDGGAGAGPHGGWLVLRIVPGFHITFEVEPGRDERLTYKGLDPIDPRLQVWVMPGQRALVLDRLRPFRPVDGLQMIAARNRDSAVSLSTHPAYREKVRWAYPQENIR